MSNDPYKPYSQSNPEPRRRRADRGSRQTSPYQPPVQQPQRPVYQPDDERAPLPLNGRGSLPPLREVPAAYDYERHPPQDVEPYEDDYEAPALWPKMLALLLVLLLAIAAALYFLVPKDTSGIMGTLRGGVAGVVDGALALVGIKEEAPPKLIKFETPLTQSRTGVKTVFTFTVDSPIEGVRIMDEQSMEVKGAVSAIDVENTVWTLTTVFDQPMSSILRAGMLRDNVWYNSDKTIAFSAEQPTPEPTFSPVPQPVFVPSLTFTPVPLGDASADPFMLTRTETPQPLALVTPSATPAPTQAPTAAAALIVTGAPASDIIIQTAEPLTLPEMPVTQEPLQETTEAPQETNVPAPAYSPIPLLTLTAAEKQAAKAMGITDTVYQKGKKLTELTRTEPLNMPGPDEYVYYDGGVFTFRGDSFRRNAAFGTADMPLKQLSVLWKAPLGSIRTADDTLYGVGWTGQPAIVKWAKEVREMMNLNDEKKAVSVLKEVIVAAQDGKVYFFDLNDGLPTRDPISVGYPLKGSVSVDTMGRPMIGFGQAISKMPGKTGAIGYYLYGLIDQKELFFINGRQTKTQSQYSTNGAFDGTALFERNTDSLVLAGENGLLYTLKLNTAFDFLDKKTIDISPEITYLKSKADQENMSVASEASVAMYGKYAFMADRRGILKAVDTDTMTTVWAFDTGDNTDATPALGFDEDGSLGLYTGTTVFTRTRKAATAYIRRIDALTGAEVWKYEIAAKFNEDERGGVKASPVVGEKGISGLVIFTVNLTGDGEKATIVALDRKTGAEVWKRELDNKAISSPVAVYDQAGQAYLIQADEQGILSLMDARTGSVLHTLDIGGKIDGSPAVYNDMLVIAATGKDNNNLYGIRLE